MSALSDDQRRRIEENKTKALARRAEARLRQQNGTSGQVPTMGTSNGQKSSAQYRASHSEQATKGLCTNQKEAVSPGTSHKETSSNAASAQPQQSASHAATQNSTFYSQKRSSHTASATASGSSTFQKQWKNDSSNKAAVTAVHKMFDTAARSKTKHTGKCVLTSRCMFEVQITYHAKLIKLFHTMETKDYNSKTRRWSFHLKEYRTLMAKLGDLRDEVHLEGLPGSVLQAFRNQLSGKEEEMQVQVNLTSLPENLLQTLMPFQREGIEFVIRNNGRALIADDMGLGKTLQAICLSYYYRREWPLLVVVPSSLRFAWREQFLKWIPDLDPQQINVAVTGKDSAVSGKINIISYDLMSKKAEEIQERRIQVVIMDESHFLKNSKTVRAKASVPVLKRAKRVILLSGTPALSRPSELFSQLHAINTSMFPAFQQFGLRYCDGKQMQWGWDFSGSSNMNELEILLREKIMIRRLKGDVLSQLPPKRRQMVLLDPTSVKLNKQMKNSHKVVDKAKGGERKTMLLEYFHDTATAKVAAVKEYMMDRLEAGNKFLLFAHHQEMLSALEDAVKSKNYAYIKIDGRTGSELRNQLCNNFQSDDNIRIALLSITAANVGLNFTAASLVVFAELFWNPGALVQAEDRAHRVGQLDSVNVDYLVASGTADDFIWPILQHKLEVLSKAGLSKDDFGDTDTTRLKNRDTANIASYFEQFFEDDDDRLLATCDTAKQAEPSKEQEAETLKSSTHPSPPNASCGTRVFFDLETSGIHYTSDIVQISAIYETDSGDIHEFNDYVKPAEGSINIGASLVTGIFFKKGRMYVNHVRVHAMQPKAALIKFLVWLKAVHRPVLWAHNAKAFDSRILWTAAGKFNLLNKYMEVIGGFVDTLPLMKQVAPKRSIYKQTDLVADFLGESYPAHNSIEDVRALKKLVEHFKIEDDVSVDFHFNFRSVGDAILLKEKNGERTTSFQPLIETGVLSLYMAKKLATEGIDFEVLKQTFTNEDYVLHAPLHANNKAKGITLRKPIALALLKYFQHLAQED